MPKQVKKPSVNPIPLPPVKPISHLLPLKIIFLIGLEMTLGRNIFKAEEMQEGTHSIVPLAFPVIAGAGTMTTLISLKSQFEEENIIISILINLIFIYLVLRSSVWIEKKLGNVGTQILRKVFGVILIAIAIKIIKTRLF